MIELFLFCNAVFRILSRHFAHTAGTGLVEFDQLEEQLSGCLRSYQIDFECCSTNVFTKICVTSPFVVRCPIECLDAIRVCTQWHDSLPVEGTDLPNIFGFCFVVFDTEFIAGFGLASIQMPGIAPSTPAIHALS